MFVLDDSMMYKWITISLGKSSAAIATTPSRGFVTDNND